MNALVIDDDPALVRVVSRWLERAGYSVLPSSDFMRARTTLNAHRVDLVVADIRLGEFNGLQLAARAREAGAATKIVVISGWADTVLAAEAVRLGAVFLPKPFTELELSAATWRAGHAHRRLRNRS